MMALLMVAIMILRGVLLRTFFTSSPAHMLEWVLNVDRKERLSHMEYSIVTGDGES